MSSKEYSKNDLKQTAPLGETRERLFDLFLADPEYIAWSESLDFENQKLREKEEAHDHQAREFKIHLTLESDCPIVLDRLREAIESELESNEKLTAFCSELR